MSEEVVQAQRAGRSKTAILALAAAVVGLGIGYGVGGLAKGAEGAKAAVQGAGDLAKEIEVANTKVTELNEILKTAAGKVRNNEFPSAEIEQLGAFDIPFDGNNLTNKGIGRFNSTAVTMLLNYSTSIADLKEQKDKVRRLFGAAKPQFEELVKERTAPRVHWSVVVTDGPHGKWAQMRPLGAGAFLASDRETRNYSWPGEVEIAKDTKAQLYKKGEPESSNYIPVDPSTEGAVCPQNMQVRLMGALMDLGSVIVGDKTPGHEKDGVAEKGNKLIDQLKKIGANPNATAG